MLTYVRAGLKKRLHVDRRVIAQNRKDGGNRPAVTVQLSTGPLKAREVNVLGNSTFVQAGVFRRDVDGSRRIVKPLKCGARVWIETTAALEVIT